MPSVREFVESVLHELNKISPVQHDCYDTESNELGILTRYESIWSFEGLRGVLLRILENKIEDADLPGLEEEVDDRLIDYFSMRLAVRWKLVVGTNSSYNSEPRSFANRAYFALADKLANVYNEMNGYEANGSEHNNNNAVPDGSKHAYHFIFADVANIDEYVSSRGKLTDLKLNEFIWVARVRKDEGVELVPVETLASLDRYRDLVLEGKDAFPVFTCLPDNTGRTNLLNNEQTLIMSDNDKDVSLAGRYYWAITEYSNAGADKKKALEQEIAKHRENFVAQLTSDKGPFYRYKNSDMQLIQNGWLKTLNVHDINGLALLLQSRTLCKDWTAFLQALEVGENPTLLQVTLPEIMGKPDTTCFDPAELEAFKRFINTPTFYACDGDVHPADADIYYRAVLFILTELYIYHRDFQKLYTGLTSQLTDGVIGYNKEDKMKAAEVFQAFLLDQNYYLNQLDTYLERTGNSIYKNALLTGRLRYLSAKSNEIGYSIDKSLNEVDKLASALCDLPSSEWQGFLTNKYTNDNDLRVHIDAHNGLKQCISDPGYYRKNDPKHNKAVLFIFAEIYERKRQKQTEHTGLLDRYASFGYDKSAKLNAVSVFKSFLTSQYGLNDLKLYLSKTNQEKSAGALFDKYSYGSELKALVFQAEALCDPHYDFSRKPDANAVATKKSWASYLNF